jgi:uncharacterized protein
MLGEQRDEHLGVGAAPAGDRIPAWACPVAGDRRGRELGRVAVTGGDVVEGLVVLRAAGDLVDGRVDEAEVAVGVSAAAAPVVAAFGLAALTPATRPLLDDQRIADLNRRQLAYHVLLRIPVGTVAWEEIAFRGVLQAALRRVLAEPAATAVGSAVFGLWHIRPTAEALAANRLAAGRGARIFAVTTVAAGTAGAGAVLSLLRERSGSLAAPVLLHLAANCAGPLASALARPTDRRGRS